MAINISDNNPRVNYTATSGQTVFTVPFEFFASTDLTVYVDGSVLAVSDYTVTGGSGSTGSITTDSGQTTGAKIAIVRDVPLERTTDLTSTYSASSLNDQLDRIVTQIADLDDRVSRSISLNDYEVGVSLDLPATATRLGKTIQFNSSTGALEIGPSGNELTSIASIASEITALDGIKANITTVAGAITNVNSVGSNISSVTSVASSISNVNTVNTNIANVNSVATSITDVNDVADSIDQVELVAGSISNVDVVGAAISNVNTVASGISNINTVAGISSNVTTVAGITSAISTVNSNATNINTAATNIANVNVVANVITKVTTVSDNIANVNTVAPSVSYLSTVANNIANINTVAPISADITTVAGVASSVSGAAANAAAAEAAKVAAQAAQAAAELAADNFDDTYLGAKSSDPTADNDGDALTAGDLYFSTTDNNLKVYTGSAWQAAALDASGFVDVTGDSMTGNLLFGDGDAVRFGTHSDLTIEHDLNNSNITGSNNRPLNITTNGTLNINSDNIYFREHAASNTYIEMRDGGGYDHAVRIFHSGTDVRLETTSTGININGNATFGDNDKAIFGAGSDLQIYHDTTASRIVDAGTGSLKIQAENFAVNNVGDTENMITATPNGAVSLFYDGLPKLVTTSTGIAVTGNATFADNGKAIFGAGSDLQIYHDGTGGNSYIDEIGSGSLFIRDNDNIALKKQSDNANMLVARAGAEVELYHNGSEKLATTSTGVDITGDVGATTATITGKTTTDELDLNAISETISDTAVDIFVYDTRKDSDGGAWRKRTQGTSWYNETLNTATRGSRKEFPSVAVIVGTSTKLTIYDGDDPDLPMWMVFNVGGSNPTTNAIGSSSANGGTCCASLNGIIFYGGNGGNYQNGQEINLIKEVIHRHSIETTNGIYQGNISERNSAKGWGGTQLPLVAFQVNDVAMTVLPNAPIDAATGLPVPTIAVATDGGVSVIKDDGTVVDITTTYNTNNTSDYINFTSDNRLYFCSRGKNYPVVADIPSSDVSSVQSSDVIFWPEVAGTTSGLDQVTVNNTNVTDIAAATDNSISFGGPKGIIYAQNVENISADKTAVFAQITSDFNTGYQNGDIKLATLSDTDDTDVTGSELVTNGTFDSDTSGWTALAGATISKTDPATEGIDTPATDGLPAPSSSGIIKIVSTGSNSGAYQSFTTVVGKKYTATFYGYQVGYLSNYLKIGTSAADGSLASVYGTDYDQSVNNNWATGSVTFTATSTTTYITLIPSQVSGRVLYQDEISVRLAEEDRSVNGNGLQVFGTVTKNPVATGADLVYYSGADGSNTNFLFQPYNSDLNFGTGDFSYTFWHSCASSGSDRIWLSHGRYTTAGSGLSILQYNSGGTGDEIIIYIGASSAGNINITGVEGLGFQHWVVTRRSGIVYAYRNGKLEGSVANTTDIDLSSATIKGLYLGKGNNTSTEGNAFVYGGHRLALFRASATAPSLEQIKKIYEDEKFLFQENAQATLYGSSDAVTALAYDDSTELLHVGTSAGRSVFQGLRRVDNTTTAVGAAISASNGLVADE